MENQNAKTNPEQGTLWRPRRDFLSAAAWATFWAVVGGFLVILGKFLVPRKEPFARSAFVAGLPADYAAGEVSDRWLNDHQTWIVHSGPRIYAIWARCTHMNCTTKWDRNVSTFQCPCHRSLFDIEGVTQIGPAPRSLDRFRVTLNRRGEIVVDKSIVFRSADQWGREGAYIDV